VAAIPTAALNSVPKAPVEVKPKTRGRSSTVGVASSAASRPISELMSEGINPQNPPSKTSAAATGQESILPAIPAAKKGRDRSKTIEVTSDAYAAAKSVIGSEPVSANGSKKSVGKLDEPRSLRFTFSLSTTSTKDSAHILKELERVLKEGQVSFKTDAFTFTCKQFDVEFEIEICRIPRLSLNGLRIKRLTGNSWEYKNMITQLVGKMDI
jgi:MAP/microtubule affinity-regulating kinase